MKFCIKDFSIHLSFIITPCFYCILLQNSFVLQMSSTELQNVEECDASKAK